MKVVCGEGKRRKRRGSVVWRYYIILSKKTQEEVDRRRGRRKEGFSGEFAFFKVRRAAESQEKRGSRFGCTFFGCGPRNKEGKMRLQLSSLADLTLFTRKNAQPKAQVKQTLEETFTLKKTKKLLSIKRTSFVTLFM